MKYPVITLIALTLAASAAWLSTADRKPAPDRARSRLRATESRARPMAAAATANSTGESGPVSTSSEAADSGPPAFAVLAARFALTGEARRTMSAARQSRIEQKYALLFERWELPADLRREIVGALAEADAAGMERNLQLAAASPQERARLLGETKAEDDAVEQHIATLLGAERFAEYGEHNARFPVLLQIERVAQRLSETPEPLRPEQRGPLLQAIVEANRRNSADTVPAELESGLPLSAESAQLLAGILERSAAVVRDAASAVLSPAQLSAFRDIQQQQLDITRRGLDLMR